MIDKKDLSKLNEVIEKLQTGNNTLIETITGGRLKDEKLMEYTLGTTEDINKTLSREEDLKSGSEIAKFVSYFENNKISLKNSLLTSEINDSEINKLYKTSYDNDNELDKEIFGNKNNQVVDSNEIYSKNISGDIIKNNSNNKFGQNNNIFMNNTGQYLKNKDINVGNIDNRNNTNLKNNFNNYY